MWQTGVAVVRSSATLAESDGRLVLASMLCRLFGSRLLKHPLIVCPANRQWDEPRLLQRAAQLVDRNPNRRLFQPQRVMHPQPATVRPPRVTQRGPRAPHVAASASRRRGSTAAEVAGPTATFESDFSDHSEWESDSWTLTDLNLAADVPEPVMARRPRAVEPLAQPAPAEILQDEVPRPTQAEVIRNDRIAQAVEYLRTHHACTHNKWHFRKGRHQCEECRHTLKEYIFECRQCSLQACNRCRRNRL